MPTGELRQRGLDRSLFIHIGRRGCRRSARRFCRRIVFHKLSTSFSQVVPQRVGLYDFQCGHMVMSTPTNTSAETSYTENGNGYAGSNGGSPSVKGVPANIEAEQAVLGSLLIDPDAIIKVANFLRPEDFYRERHSWLYEAMLALNERREPVDFVTLVDELERREQLAEVGGPAYITDLISNTPTAIYVDHYARIVERTALRRRLISGAGKIAELAYDESQETQQVLERSEQIIFGISESQVHRDLVPIHSVMQDVVNQLDFLARHQGSIMGIPTGFHAMDKMLGGFQQSDLIILAARPGMGKSSFALSIAQKAAQNLNARIGIFSLEMSSEQMVQRLLSMESRIDSHRLRLGQVYEEEWPILLEVANSLANTNVFIDDTPGVSISEIRTKARRLYAEHGLDLLIIDYMQLMTGTNSRNENRQQEISYISRSLKELARELSVPVIALSQLSRAVESRSDKRPMLSDLRESGCLTGETLITMADGCRVPIAELCGRSGFDVFSLNTSTWKLEQSTVSNAFCTGTKPVHRMKTALGCSLRATGNHKFLTMNGWKRLDELTVGDRIALPRQIQTSEPATMTDDELAFLGHLIGDGCTLPRHAIQYTTRERDLAETVADLSTRIFGDKVAPRINPERNWYQVYLTSTLQHTHGVRSAIAEWLDELGVWGLRSWEKRIPDKVFAQPASSISVFLRHLWSTDGCVRVVAGKSPRAAIYYASSSPELASGVQKLLLRLGINARVSQISQGDKGRPQYHTIVSGKSDVEAFCRSVGAVGEYKIASIKDVIAFIDSKKENTNRDVIPSDVWNIHVKPAMQQHGITHRELHRRMDMAYAGMTMFKQNLSRERAARVAESVGCQKTQALAESDVYWDKIVSIEPEGVEPVYDLTVPGNHNFVANGIVAHNSIEQDADVVMFIYREDYYIEDTDRQNIADIIVAKHRHGSTGTVSLYFRKELTQFNDMEIQRTDLDY